MAAAAAASCVPEIRLKCPREDGSSFEDTHSDDNHDDQNLHKRSRDCLLLSDFLSTDEIEGVDTVQHELLLLVIKNLQEEISGTSEMPSTSSGYIQIEENSTFMTKNCTGEVGESVNSYEYLVTATDDELGISPSPPLCVDEDDSRSFSKNFWSDLFQNSSTEPDSTAHAVDLIHRCLSHCYSYNYRDWGELNSFLVSDSDRQDWIAESLTDWS